MALWPEAELGAVRSITSIGLHATASGKLAHFSHFLDK